MTAPLRVAVTGAAGNIGYSLVWRLASGSCFGPDQPIILSLLEIPQGMQRLEGVVMEIVDSAFPLVHDIVATDDAGTAFADADAIFLVGSRPRTAGMERGDLVAANGPIFVGQGKAINRARSSVKVVTVGNPCNTNCLIASHYGSDIPKSQFTAMTRLDQNRAVGQLSSRLGVPPADVKDVVIWGNHGPEMYPDVTWASAGGKPVREQVDAGWLQGDFLKTVAQRGKAIIEARGASSAASAASAAIDHMRDWHLGTGGDLVSMAVVSQGQYGVPEGLVFSMPVRCEGGSYEVVEGLELDDFGKAKLAENIEALAGEREAVADLLG
ncbi:MAG: malate dehydrogenase [Alphaproteobacteria bacterium]|nr:malate dehydrogenase [Alphaproteobacteria bacterium]